MKYQLIEITLVFLDTVVRSNFERWRKSPTNKRSKIIVCKAVKHRLGVDRAKAHWH
jgi:hypothetical protein